MRKPILKYRITVVAILIVAFLVRAIGVNWDDNHHLHPDERFLTMVTQSLVWSPSFTDYLDTRTSTLNPHNTGYGFYVYGTLPLLTVKSVSTFLRAHTYDGITIVGRLLSALVDTGTVLLVYLILRRLKANPLTSALGMILYAASALPIQLSHFFAVDPYVTFFSMLGVYLAMDRTTLPLGWMAVAIAASAKVTGGASVIPVGILSIRHIIRSRGQRLATVGILILSVLAAMLTFRIAYPYLFDGFMLNPKVVENLQQLDSLNDKASYFPPGIQWITATPYLFPLLQMAYYGLGVPIFLLTVVGIGLAVIRWRSITPAVAGLLLYAIGLFAYQGGAYVKALRYFYPVYPALAVIAAWGLSPMLLKLVSWRSRGRMPLLLIIALALVAWPYAVTRIYTTPHTRIAASRWIFANIPPGSTITSETWDDGLPLSIGVLDHTRYTTLSLPVTGPDTPEKIKELYDAVSRADYIILTSNRGYGSILTVPDRFPQTSMYYRKLFDGSLGFRKVAEFTSRPTVPFLIPICVSLPFQSYGAIAKSEEECGTDGISFVDDYADETWTVYDHPKVTIFKKY